MSPLIQDSPGGLLSEKHSAEDLAKSSGTEQVLGPVLAHSRKMPQQTLESQPVLGWQAWGAGDVTQQLGAFLRVHHLCWKRRDHAEGQMDETNWWCTKGFLQIEHKMKVHASDNKEMEKVVMCSWFWKPQRDCVVHDERKVQQQVIGCSEMIEINLQACFSCNQPQISCFWPCDGKKMKLLNRKVIFIEREKKNYFQ